MTDLHAWITQQVDETESVARAAADGDSGEWFMGRKWNVYRAEDQTPTEDDETNALVAYGNVKDQSEHIAHHDPAAVLRRCETDRRILARHRLDPAAAGTPRDKACTGCGHEWVQDECLPFVDNINHCPELVDLAHAHGITPETLAGYQERTGP